MDWSCFLTEYYYVIRPTPQFIARVAACPDPAVVEMMCSSTLWSRKEGGLIRSSAEPYIRFATDRVKLLFLASFRSAGEFAEVQGLLPEIAHASQLTTETFDHWWTIERLELQDDVEVISDDVDVAALQALAAPDDPDLQEWLDAVIRQKQEAKTETP